MERDPERERSGAANQANGRASSGATSGVERGREGGSRERTVDGGRRRGLQAVRWGSGSGSGSGRALSTEH